MKFKATVKIECLCGKKYKVTINPDIDDKSHGYLKQVPCKNCGNVYTVRIAG